MAIDFSRRKYLNAESTKSVRISVFNHDDVVCAEGETERTMYEVLSGHVRVVINYGKPDQMVVATKNPGDYFGEIALIEDRPRTATIIAGENETRLREISLNGFIHYVKERPEILMPITDAMADRYKELRKQYHDCCTDFAQYFDAKKKRKAVPDELTERIEKYLEYGSKEED